MKIATYAFVRRSPAPPPATAVMYATIPGEVILGMLEMACYLFTVAAALVSCLWTAAR